MFGSKERKRVRQEKEMNTKREEHRKLEKLTVEFLEGRMTVEEFGVQSRELCKIDLRKLADEFNNRSFMEKLFVPNG